MAYLTVKVTVVHQGFTILFLINLLNICDSQVFHPIPDWETNTSVSHP